MRSDNWETPRAAIYLTLGTDPEWGAAPSQLLRRSWINLGSWQLVTNHPRKCGQTGSLLLHHGKKRFWNFCISQGTCIILRDVNTPTPRAAAQYQKSSPAGIRTFAAWTLSPHDSDWLCRLSETLHFPTRPRPSGHHHKKPRRGHGFRFSSTNIPPLQRRVSPVSTYIACAGSPTGIFFICFAFVFARTCYPT